MLNVEKIVKQVLLQRELMASAGGNGTSLRDDAVATQHETVDALRKQGADRITAGPGISRHAGFDVTLAGVIDHTDLRPEATLADISTLCREARRYGFASVCVHPSYVALCQKELKSTNVRVCTVIGFPHGATSSGVKLYETRIAQEHGAVEFDVVMNIGRLKSGDTAYVLDELRKIVRSVKKGNITHLVKVILETCLLTDREKITACLLASEAGADYVKTSTGFGKSGATVGDVSLIRRVVEHTVGVKASGGVRDQETALELIRHGADRIGASASIKIINT